VNVVAFDDDDSGRQRDRTTMAWVRTALAAVAVGLLTERLTETDGERWLVVVGMTIGVVGFVAVAWLRTQRLRHERSPAAFGPVSSIVVVGSLLLLNVVGLLVAL
jgi:uncharacterized membrane protein YidH (DUF202 family)